MTKWLLAAVLAALAPRSHAEVWESTLLNRQAMSDTGNAGSACGSLSSADGRFLAFCSASANLVVGQADTTGFPDTQTIQQVFLLDRSTGSTLLVSHALGAPLTAANRLSEPVAVSADGAYVLFRGTATNLVGPLPGAYLDINNVYLYERSSGTVTLVSRSTANDGLPALGNSTPIALSADGRWVLFSSNAGDVAAGATDSNNSSDAYLYDRLSGTSILVAHAPGAPNTAASGGSTAYGFSADGRWTLIYANGSYSLFDRDSGATTTVAHAAGAPGIPPDGPFSCTVVSADGSSVLCSGSATNIVPGLSRPKASGYDVFLYGRSTDSFTLVSHLSGAALVTANDNASPVAISADGSRVLYASTSTKLVSGFVDGNSAGGTDYYLFDRASGISVLATRSSDDPQKSATDAPTAAALSADGSRVIYASTAADVVSGFVDNDGSGSDVYLFDRPSGHTFLVSHAAANAARSGNATSAPTLIGSDGKTVLFRSRATDLVAGLQDSNNADDLFVYDTATGLGGIAVHNVRPTTLVDSGGANLRALSSDGSRALFENPGTTYVANSLDRNEGFDAFVFDRDSDVTTIASHALGQPGTAGNAQSFPVGMDASGNSTVFVSAASNLVGATPYTGVAQDYLYDRISGTVTLVSHALSGAAVLPNGGVNGQPQISADGDHVAFGSCASDLVVGINYRSPCNVFVFDRANGSIQLVSHALGNVAATANNGSTALGISADGNRILFQSTATDLVSGFSDGNSFPDYYLYDRPTGVIQLVTRAASSPTTSANNQPSLGRISADGRRVVYDSSSTNVVPGQTESNGIDGADGYDVFLFDAVGGTTTLVSHAAGAPATTGNRSSQFGAVSADGGVVTFESSATDLIGGYASPAGILSGVYLYDVATDTLTLASRALGQPTTAPNSSSHAVGVSDDGNRVLILSGADNIVPGVTDANHDYDAFVFDRRSNSTALVSHAAASATTTANGYVWPYVFSADGNCVLSQTRARNLVGGLAYPSTFGYAPLLSCRRLEVTVTASAGGSVSPAPVSVVRPGTTLSIAIAPHSGYDVQSVSGCGGNWTGSGPYLTAPVQSDCTVTASFVLSPNVLFLDDFE